MSLKRFRSLSMGEDVASFALKAGIVIAAAWAIPVVMVEGADIAARVAYPKIGAAYHGMSEEEFKKRMAEPRTVITSGEEKNGA